MSVLVRLNPHRWGRPIQSSTKITHIFINQTHIFFSAKKIEIFYSFRQNRTVSKWTKSAGVNGLYTPSGKQRICCVPGGKIENLLKICYDRRKNLPNLQNLKISRIRLTPHRWGRPIFSSTRIAHIFINQKHTVRFFLLKKSHAFFWYFFTIDRAIFSSTRITHIFINQKHSLFLL